MEKPANIRAAKRAVTFFAKAIINQDKIKGIDKPISVSFLPILSAAYLNEQLGV